MTSALGAGIGGYFGQQAGQRNINKQLASQEKLNNDYLARLGSIGAIGYVPNQGMRSSGGGNLNTSLPAGSFRVK
jgi:hypothetical protein